MTYNSKINKELRKLSTSFTSIILTSGTALTFLFTAVVLSQFTANRSLDSISNQGAIAQTTINLTNLRNASLSKHNSYRAIHRTPRLTSSSSLNTSAQNWAQYLANNGLFEHSTASQRNNAGEH